MDYNDGKWHGWNNDPMPKEIHPESKIMAIWCDEFSKDSRVVEAIAADIAWKDDFDGTQSIKAFKILKEES